MRLFISSNSSLSSDRAEIVKFAAEICDEYGSQLIEVVECSSSDDEEIMSVVATCDMFIVLTDEGVDDRVMKEFNAATLCNMKGISPIIYLYNREPEERVVPTKNRELLIDYYIDDSKRYWCRYANVDFMRIIFAFQMEAYAPNIFATGVIDTKIYLRNLLVGDMTKSPAIINSYAYNKIQQYYDEAKDGSEDRINRSSDEIYEKLLLSRTIRQKRAHLLLKYYNIYKKTATLPTRATTSQLRVGYNNIYNGDIAAALKSLDLKELSDRVSHLAVKLNSDEKLSQYERIEIDSAVEAMGLRAQVALTDLSSADYIDQANDSLQKALVAARDGRSMIFTYAQHVTAYADFLKEYKNSQDGAKWYEGALEMLLRIVGEDHIEVATAYLNVANYYIEVGNDEKAMWALKSALSIFSKLSPHHPLIGLIYWGFAKIHRGRGEYLEALTCCATGEKLYLMTHSESDPMSIKFWFMQINLRREASMRNFTIDEFLAKQKVFYKFDDLDEQLIDFYLFFADRYIESSCYSEAEEILRVALMTSNFSLGEFCRATIEVIIRLIEVNRSLGQRQNALRLVDSLINRIKHNKDIDMKINADAHYTMAGIKSSLSDYSGAVESYQKAISLYRSISGEGSEDEAHCYNNIADLSCNSGQYDEAIENFKKSIEIIAAKYGEFHINVAKYYNKVAETFFKKEDYTTALEYFNFELECYESAEEPSHRYMAFANENIARALFYMGGKEAVLGSLDYQKEAYRLFEVGTALDDMFRTLSGLAVIYDELEEYEDEIIALEKINELVSLHEEYRDDESYAHIIQRIASARRNMYDYGLAEKSLKDALQIYISYKGEESAEVVSVYKDMANLYYQAERFDDAALYGEMALKGSQVLFASDSAEVLSAMSQLESAYCKIGAYDEALDLVMKRVDIITNKEDRKDNDLMVVYYHVSLVYKSKGDYKNQIEWLERSVELEESIPSAVNTSIANSLFNLGSAYCLWSDENNDREKLLKAKDILLRGVAIFNDGKSQEEYSRENLSIWATGYLYLANVCSSLRDYDDALSFVERAEALYKAADEVDNYIYCYNIYAMIYDDMNSYDKAIEYYNKAVDLLDEDDDSSCVIYGNIARCYQNSCNFEEMLRYMTLAYDATFGLLDDDDVARANVYSNLGDAYIEVGDYARAKDCFGESLYIYEKKEEESVALSSQLSSMGYVTLLNKEYEKSIDYSKRSLDIRLKLVGENSLLTANCYSYLGRAYIYTGRMEEARELLFKTLEIRRSLLGSEPSYEMASAYYGVGELLIHEGRYDEAVKYLSDSIDLYNQLYNADDNTYIARSLHSIGIAYKQSGGQTKAVEYLNRALAIRSKFLRDTHPDLVATREALNQ